MSALTLLLIEDEPQVRRFLRSSLEPTECKVLEASTGEAGLEMAVSRHPDVILLDLGLPDLDGLEVTRRLREWTATPIIVLSKAIVRAPNSAKEMTAPREDESPAFRRNSARDNSSTESAQDPMMRAIKTFASSRNWNS